MPTFNRGGLIGRALSSIENQTLLPMEIIVVDDGSTDNTRDVVIEFAKNSVVEVKLIQQENRGAPAARNAGISAAVGSLIAFQDSDDTWDESFLETLYKSMQESGSGVVFSSHRVHFLEGGDELRPAHKITDVGRALLKENVISTQTALVRAGLLLDTKFDVRLPRLQDWELWLRLRSNTQFTHVPVPLATLYRQADSLTQSDAAYFAALRLIVAKHWKSMASHPLFFAKHVAKCIIGRPIKANRS